MGRLTDLNYRRRQHQRMTTRWIPAWLLADCLNKKMEKCDVQCECKLATRFMEHHSIAWLHGAWKRPFLLRGFF